MGDISRVRSAWTGFPGGPGVTTMYFVDTATACAELKTFWEAVKGLLPSDVRILVENAGDTVDSVTGALTGAWSADAETATVGDSSDKYSAPAGAVINWNTETIGPH